MAGVEEVHILWTSELLGCDGDSVSVTAATLPRIEDVLSGHIPGLPKVHLHNKVLSPTLGGDEFLAPFFAAARGELGAPFIFVVEGSIPNEQINGDGYWTSFGNDEATGEPLTLNWWIDQLAHKAWGWWRLERARPTAASTRWRAIPPAAWAWPTTWDGISAPPVACRSSTCPAVRCSRRTSWRR